MKYDYRFDGGTARILKPGRPLNQTEEHFFCENVGQMFLFHYCNCRYISTEVKGCWHLDENINGYTTRRSSNGINYWYDRGKNIIDVIGMPRKLDTVYGVEAKVSISDFRNGFCASMPYTYIICPKDIIPIELIPKKIGLIYVDIPNFHVVGYNEMHGVRIIKNARKRIDARWLDKNGEFSADKLNKQMDKWYDDICYRNSIKNVYNRSNLPLYKKVYNPVYEKIKE